MGISILMNKVGDKIQVIICDVQGYDECGCGNDNHSSVETGCPIFQKKVDSIDEATEEVNNFIRRNEGML